MASTLLAASSLFAFVGDPLYCILSKVQGLTGEGVATKSD